MRHANQGFTLIEVLVAIVLLTVGILALVGSSSSVSRMIGRGRTETRAAQAASRRLETLRLAGNAVPRCADPRFVSGGPVLAGGMTESWQVSGSGKIRRIQVTIAYVTVRGVRTAALETSFAC